MVEDDLLKFKALASFKILFPAIDRHCLFFSFPRDFSLVLNNNDKSNKNGWLSG